MVGPSLDYTIGLTSLDYTIGLTSLDYTIGLTSLDYTIGLTQRNAREQVDHLHMAFESWRFRSCEFTITLTTKPV